MTDTLALVGANPAVTLFVVSPAALVDGQPLPGRPRTSGTVERPTSSAVLTDAEVWTHGSRMPPEDGAG